MELPYRENAIVVEAKIILYLLNPAHEDGKSKAAFFLHFGFSVTQWEIMRDALLTHAREHEVASVLETSRNKHYAIEGELNTPSGKKPQVRTVWALEIGSEIPRFITAYPLKVKKGADDDSGT
jgi:hypothetical protein